MKHLLLSISIVCLLMVGYTAVNGAEWVYYGYDSFGNECYYDKEGITSVGDGIIKVWEKIVFSEEGKSYFISERQKKGINTQGYENLSYDLGLYAINCNKKEFHVVSGVDYTKAGHILDSFNLSSDKTSWDPIPPDSIMDELYKATCKETKKKK